jgi:hypothetical protein
VRPDTGLLATLKAYGALDVIGEDNIFPTLDDAFRAYEGSAEDHPRMEQS